MKDLTPLPGLDESAAHFKCSTLASAKQAVRALNSLGLKPTIAYTGPLYDNDGLWVSEVWSFRINRLWGGGFNAYTVNDRGEEELERFRLDLPIEPEAYFFEVFVKGSK